MSSVYDSAFDGNVPRWRVRCGFECQGERCGVVGESAQNPEAPKAKRVKIFCPRHAREEGRTLKGRNKEDRRYVMCLSEEDKERARADRVTTSTHHKKRISRAPAVTRKNSVATWLGCRDFEECSVFHRNMILDELRVPPLLLGRDKDPTRVYFLSSFRLADLKYLFKKRPSDNRRLILVRGSSIIRCDIISFVGDAWFIFRKH